MSHSGVFSCWQQKVIYWEECSTQGLSYGINYTIHGCSFFTFRGKDKYCIWRGHLSFQPDLTLFIQLHLKMNFQDRILVIDQEPGDSRWGHSVFTISTYDLCSNVTEKSTFRLCGVTKLCNEVGYSWKVQITSENSFHCRHQNMVGWTWSVKSLKLLNIKQLPSQL